MEFFSVAGVAVTAAALAVLLRQHRQEYALLLGLGAGVILFLYAVLKAMPAFNELSKLLSNAGVSSEYAVILIKSLGICFVTQLASDACKDAGETAIASKVELAGKVAILLIALPLFEEVAKLAVGLLSN